MVVDGGTSFEFNDGAIASILINTEDALRTVLLEDWRHHWEYSKFFTKKWAASIQMWK